MNKQLSHEMPPYTTTYFISKIFLGLLIWGLVSVMVFAGLFFVGNMFLKNGNDPNPITALLLLLIAFGVSSLGNIFIAAILNLVFPSIHYESLSSISRIFLFNILLTFLIAPVYFLFLSNFTALLWVMAFHIGFATFVSFNFVEASVDPNYSGIHLIWTSLWFLMGLTTFLIFVSLLSSPSLIWSSYTKALLMALPPILAFFFIPLGEVIWVIIYSKIFYENGNNFLYYPSSDEVSVNEEEAEDVNVDSIS